MADMLQQRLFDCIDDVALWMMSNRLQLNHAKTKVLWCASARCQQQIPTGPVRVGSTSVFPVTTVRDLAVYLDADVSMAAYCYSNGESMLCSTPTDTQRPAFTVT